MTTHTNLNERECQTISDLLLVMAKAYFVLKTKTLGFHWNVIGSHFIELHHFFEETYDELADSLDEVSERIRALGLWAPKSVTELSHNAIIDDVDHVPAPLAMIEMLIADYDILVKQIHTILITIDAFNDESTKDLLITHSRGFEKRLWILHSLIPTNKTD